MAMPACEKQERLLAKGDGSRGTALAETFANARAESIARSTRSTSADGFTAATSAERVGSGRREPQHHPRLGCRRWPMDGDVAGPLGGADGGGKSSEPRGPSRRQEWTGVSYDSTNPCFRRAALAGGTGRRFTASRLVRIIGAMPEWRSAWIAAENVRRGKGADLEAFAMCWRFLIGCFCFLVECIAGQSGWRC